jgi:predicted nucleic acid-binding protein
MQRFDLLSNLFETVLIPKSVYDELSYKSDVSLPDFMQIKTLIDTSSLTTFNMLLDKGEAEAIALAIELNKPLIIDEKKGRKIAKNCGLKIIGLLGIVYLNIQKNHISIQEAKEFLDCAISNGYRISQKLIDDMFEKVNDVIA